MPVDGHDLDGSPATSALLRERGHEVVQLHVVGGARVIADAVYDELAGLVPVTCADSPRC